MQKKKLCNLYKKSLSIFSSVLLLITIGITGNLNVIAAEDKTVSVDAQVSDDVINESDEIDPTEETSEEATDKLLVNENSKTEYKEISASIVYGDLDGNGTANIADSVLLTKYVAGAIRLNATQKSKSDLNSDGKIDVEDTVILNKYIAEIIDKLPYDSKAQASEVNAISLSTTKVTLNVNTTYQLNTVVSPANASCNLTWNSSNKNVATVNSSGKITAKNAGQANITVKTNNGKTASCTVTVRTAPVSVSLNMSKLTLGVGESYNIHPVIIPATCTSDQYTITSNNKTVAEVSSTGIITAKSAGTATITLKTNNNLLSTCIVTVKSAPASVSVSDTSLTLGAGETYIISESTSSGSYAKSFTWSSSNTSVATVAKTASNKAQITAKGMGTATITIKTYNGKTASCKVTVKSAPASVTLSDTSLTLGAGETYIISESTNSGSYANSFTWSSSNISVATVAKTTSNKAQITAKGTGTATITIKTYNGKTASCKVTVKSAPSSVVLSDTSLTFGAGETYIISESTNSGSYANSFTWSSSNTSVATVAKTTSNKAQITAKGTGTAAITIKTYNGKTASCKVTVKSAPTSVSVSTASANLSVGQTLSIYESTNSGSYAKSFTWSSSNTSVATVVKTTSNYAKITAKAVGTAKITIKTYNGKSASCVVTVTAKTSNPGSTVTAVKLSSTASSINVGNHAYITATTTPSGQSVTWSSSNTSVATVSNGVVKGVSTGTATIKAKAVNGSASASYQITVNKENSGGLSIIYTACTASAGQTVYMKPNTSSVTLSSSNTNVATVDSKGFVKAKSKGVAIITASKNGYKKTCALTVTDAAPIRFSYSSPNSAALNDTITFVAITDKNRTAVKFTYSIAGVQYTVNATSKTLDSTGNNYVWKGSKKVGVAGSFAVTAYSMKNGSWGTCDAGKSTMYIANASSSTAVSTSMRRPSDSLLALNSNYEGYLSSVSDDPLVYDTPTIGYGHVVYGGDKFYNNLSTQEAFAWMVSDMNDSVYSNSVNNFMSSNNIKFNQQQFDALVMFVYNLGSGVLSDSSIKSVLTNCVESSGSTSSTSAYVNADALNVRSGPGTNYSSYGTISYGTRVTVLEKTTSTWYKVKTSTGITGYCYAEYLTFSSSVVRNMNLVNKNAVKSELIQWHHAGGQCVWGLLYRRIDELEVFCYGDYVRDGNLNKYNMSYRWNCG